MKHAYKSQSGTIFVTGSLIGLESINIVASNNKQLNQTLNLPELDFPLLGDSEELNLVCGELNPSCQVIFEPFKIK